MSFPAKRGEEINRRNEASGAERRLCRKGRKMGRKKTRGEREAGWSTQLTSKIQLGNAGVLLEGRRKRLGSFNADLVACKRRVAINQRKRKRTAPKKLGIERKQDGERS